MTIDIEGAEYRALPEILDAGLRPVAMSMGIHGYVACSTGKSLNSSPPRQPAIDRNACKP